MGGTDKFILLGHQKMGIKEQLWKRGELCNTYP